MQSYYSMLQTRKIVGEEIPLDYRPTFRSSAIFNVYHNDSISSRVLFMGYWLLKRNISEVGLLINLRNSVGVLVTRKYSKITSPKAVRIEVKDLLDESNSKFANFEGSIELEIFSSTDLVYPYPAFVINYYNDTFCTTVHTTGRVFNDIDDYKGNDQYKVRESGFDIYSSDEISGFFSFTNGPSSIEACDLSYEVQNSSNQILTGKFGMDGVPSYGAKTIFFNDVIPELEDFLSGKSGTIKISHDFTSFFPRFLVGNKLHETQEISLTHSYYDCSKLDNDESYWNRLDGNFIDSSIAIPIYHEGGLETILAFYPIFSPSNFSVSFRFFNQKAEEVLVLEHQVTVSDQSQEYQLVNLNEMILKNSVVLEEIVSARIECFWADKTKIPTRVKLGLNVGKREALPSNICFAPHLGNPSILLKKGTFKWSPILNHTNSEIQITNSSSLKTYENSAEVTAQFYREEDDTFVERKVTIPPFGLYTVNINKDPELNQFYDRQTGWVTFFSTNPHIYGWYFDFTESGIVAADHIF